MLRLLNKLIHDPDSTKFSCKGFVDRFSAFKETNKILKRACRHNQELLSYVYEINIFLQTSTIAANPLDNQIAKPEALMQRIFFTVLAIVLVVMLVVFAVNLVRRASDPYIKTVLSLDGDPVQGHAIFQINCAGCHGLEANGSVGPSLQGVSRRKSRFGLITQVISGKTPPMPKFQPNTQEMADLLSFLESL